MQRQPDYLAATIPGQGRRPPLDVTLHAESDTLVLAIAPAPGRAAPKNPPGPATVAALVSIVAEEVGACTFGEWQPFTEVDGEPAGWMTSVLGDGVASTAKTLAMD